MLGCGTTDWRKGPDLFIEIAQRTIRNCDRPVEFVWVGGETSRGEIEQLKRLARSKGLAHQVKFVGAAPTPVEVLEFFHAIGLPLAELWGMSETCGAGTVNPRDRIKLGTVGPAAPGVQVKLADDGEVLVKSEVVMLGYRNLPDKTSETFTEDGWLRTGDIGTFDEDGYLRIVDRKKELIINAGGKNM